MNNRQKKLQTTLQIREALTTGLANASVFAKPADKVLCIEVALQQAGFKIIKAKKEN